MKGNMVDAGEVIIKFICTIIFILIIIGMVSELSEKSTVKHIRKISGYELVELEDGHQYLRTHHHYGETLEHYIDCPKCKNK